MSRFRSLVLSVVGAFAFYLFAPFAAPVTLHAATLTFGDGAPVFAEGYTEAGVTLSGGPRSWPSIRDWPATTDSFSTGTPIGERELLFSDQFEMTFTFDSGGAFDLLGLDVENPAGLRNWSVNGSFAVMGSNGAVQSIAATVFGSVALIGFQNITSFTLSCTGCQATVDNIVFEAPTPVPLPAALPLFLTVLAGMAGLRWWRRRTTAA